MRVRVGGIAARSLGALGLCSGLFLGCSLGPGEGEVTSERLVAPGCVDGPFDLNPTFFSVNPDENEQTIRIQRGDKLQDISDGVVIALYDVDAVLARLGQPIPVALPPGVNPPGHAVEAVNDPTLVALSLLLNDSCHEQDVSLQAISGSITFDELWDGQPRAKKRDRLIEAEFSVQVADPRKLPPDGSEPDSSWVSQVDGHFRFYFRRGQPNQPFPGVE